MKLQDVQEHMARIDLQVVIDNRGDFFFSQQLAILFVEVVSNKHVQRAIQSREGVDNCAVATADAVHRLQFRMLLQRIGDPGKCSVIHAVPTADIQYPQVRRTAAQPHAKAHFAFFLASWAKIASNTWL